MPPAGEITPTTGSRSIHGARHRLRSGCGALHNLRTRLHPVHLRPHTSLRALHLHAVLLRAGPLHLRAIVLSPRSAQLRELRCLRALNLRAIMLCARPPHLRAIVLHARSLHLRPVRMTGAVIYPRSARRSRPMHHAMPGSMPRAVIHRRAMRNCGLMMSPWSPPRVVPGRMPQRHAHAVNVFRVVPVAAIPVCRPPAGNTTPRGKGIKAEYRRTAGRVAIHRLAICIAENRKTIHIVLCIRPRNRCADTTTTHSKRSACVHRVIVHYAGVQAPCGKHCYGHAFPVSFHCSDVLLSYQ